MLYTIGLISVMFLSQAYAATTTSWARKQAHDYMNYGKIYYGEQDYKSAVECFVYVKYLDKHYDLVSGATDRANYWLDAINDRKYEAQYAKQMEAQMSFSYDAELIKVRTFLRENGWQAHMVRGGAGDWEIYNKGFWLPMIWMNTGNWMVLDLCAPMPS